MKDDNYTDPDPDPEAFEDLGPDDLEPIAPAQSEALDDDDWTDPDQERRQEERRQWLEALSDSDAPNQRVIELRPFFAAVLEGHTLTFHDFENQRLLTVTFDHTRYGEDELREKLEVYVPFL